MDAITYFLVNYGLYSLLLVIPAALLGIVYGWMAWGKYRAGEIESRERLEEAEKITHEVEIELSKERERFKLYQEAAEEGGTLPAPPDLEHRIVALRRDNEELEKILKAARKERAEAEASLAEMAKESTGHGHGHGHNKCQMRADTESNSHVSLNIRLFILWVIHRKREC